MFGCGSGVDRVLPYLQLYQVSESQAVLVTVHGLPVDHHAWGSTNHLMAQESSERAERYHQKNLGLAWSILGLSTSGEDCCDRLRLVLEKLSVKSKLVGGKGGEK